jgi:hypothetical protein
VNGKDSGSTEQLANILKNIIIAVSADLDYIDFTIENSDNNEYY